MAVNTFPERQAEHLAGHNVEYGARNSSLGPCLIADSA